MQKINRLLIVLFVALCAPSVAKAQTPDPNLARAERIFNYVLHDQADSLFDNMAAKVQPMVPKDKLKGIMSQAESMAGKYKLHTSWELRDIMGQKVYASSVSFEKTELGCVVVFDTEGKVLGIQLVPSEVIKKK